MHSAPNNPTIPELIEALEEARQRTLALVANHKVLRGGCWTTRFRLLRNTWRNFYQPHRRDVWAGFRTCAAD